MVVVDVDRKRPTDYSRADRKWEHAWQKAGLPALFAVFYGDDGSRIDVYHAAVAIHNLRKATGPRHNQVSSVAFCGTWLEPRQTRTNLLAAIILYDPQGFRRSTERDG